MTIDVEAPLRVKTIRYLLLLFELSGIVVSVRARPRLQTWRLGGSLQWHWPVELVWSDDDAPLIVTDKEGRRWNDDTKVIVLRNDLVPGLKLPLGHFALPPPMHPQIYTEYAAHLRLKSFRRVRRSIKVLFAGNWGDSVAYRSKVITETLGLLSRPEVLEIACEHPDVVVLDEPEAIFDAGDRFRSKVVLLRSRLHMSRWMEAVSMADFFLSPPGGVPPWSHSCVEAMSVGTIPITNFGDWFRPHLDDRVSVNFDTSTELLAKLDEVVRMPENEIETLRTSAGRYYDHYLHYPAVFDAIQSCEKNPVYLHVLDETQDSFLKALECGDVD